MFEITFIIPGRSNWPSHVVYLNGTSHLIGDLFVLGQLVYKSTINLPLMNVLSMMMLSSPWIRRELMLRDSYREFIFQKSENGES